MLTRRENCTKHMAELRARHSPWYTLSTEVDQEEELHKTYGWTKSKAFTMVHIVNRSWPGGRTAQNIWLNWEQGIHHGTYCQQKLTRRKNCTKHMAELRARHSPWYALSTDVDQEGELHKTYGWTKSKAFTMVHIVNRSWPGGRTAQNIWLN